MKNITHPKRILITGAAGFIGSHLSLHLHARNDFVIGLDNFNDYYSPQLKYDRTKLLEKEGIQVIHGDILDKALLDELVIRHKITHIVHLAAQAGVRYSLVNPDAYVSANINGFLNILELCRKHPQLYLTYASSSSVYGTNTQTPFSVNDRTDHQASFYGVTKKTNELMAHAYHQLYKIPVTGLRFFTVYGPWGRPDMAYFSFAKAILEDRPIDVYNFGNMSRDFTYVDDIVLGIAAAVDLESQYDIFNLGNNRPESLSSLIQFIEEALGKEAQQRHLPMQSGDVEATYADIDYSRDKIGFTPTTSLKDGISRFVHWYQEYNTQRS
ncbi:MAG TPA: NAD-dependent epimerase/dehydratase family protein [Parachlamydiaceae bacterium]|nr:NAD-dependent epimerase/dehydratase family protein [Parachlamydiaceae bacterium]